jgi:hypothetical protein
MTSRPALSILPRLLLGLVVQGLLGGPTLAQDLSFMSDFGMADFFHDSAQIIQNGASNRANISQSNDFGGSAANYAEIKQDGGDNDASITPSIKPATAILRTSFKLVLPTRRTSAKLVLATPCIQPKPATTTVLFSRSRAMPPPT